MQFVTMRRTTTISILIWLMAVLHSTPARALAGFTLSAKDKQPCAIIVATNAPASERYAAEELQRYLERITGVKPSIVDDSCPAGTHEILLGDNQHLRKLGLQLDSDTLGPTAFARR